MTLLDWIIVIAYFALAGAIGFSFRRRGGRSLDAYFVSGRSLPWWLAGTSMVATTFAADTPIAITGIVAREGVSGNWVWWGLLPGGLATVFFFAALWNRARVLTDVELISLRYGGRPSRFLRIFRAAFLGILINGFIMGWVNLAMIKILTQVLDVDAWLALSLALAMTVGYATLSGLWGVVVADFVQFLIGMGGTIALAFFAVNAVGGLDRLPDMLASALHPATGTAYDTEALLSFLPGDALWSLPAATFAAYLFVTWWASWYPGAEPGGGGYIAQRLLATKNERHAVLAGLWFNVAHYALRPWPWIVAGLCGIALYAPHAALGARPDPELYYVRLITDLLPSGWRGLLLAAFAAAYMSTISTQLNWGASYVVNDLWRPLSGRIDPRREVLAARVTTVAMLALSVFVTLLLGSIGAAWKFVIAIGAGTGLPLILRWYWWRINAWSEIASMAAALACALTLLLAGRFDEPTGWTLLLTVAVATAVWLAVTLLTRPESEEVLKGFCSRVRPPGPGWRRIVADPPPLQLGPRLGAFGGALLLIYGVLFGTGHLLIGSPTMGWRLFGAAAGGALLLGWLLRHEAFAARPLKSGPLADHPVSAPRPRE